MSKSKITDTQLKKELSSGTSVPDIAKKYNLTPKGVRNHITRLHKKEREETIHHKTYGQQQAEKLKSQTRINLNNALREMLEREKAKNQELMQKVKELEQENGFLREEWDKYHYTKTKK